MSTISAPRPIAQKLAGATGRKWTELATAQPSTRAATVTIVATTTRVAVNLPLPSIDDTPHDTPHIRQRSPLLPAGPVWLLAQECRRARESTRDRGLRTLPVLEADGIPKFQHVLAQLRIVAGGDGEHEV